MEIEKFIELLMYRRMRRMQGQSAFDAGLFYCPYVPLSMTNLQSVRKNQYISISNQIWNTSKTDSSV